jgi:hypothetical protein
MIVRSRGWTLDDDGLVFARIDGQDLRRGSPLGSLEAKVGFKPISKRDALGHIPNVEFSELANLLQGVPRRLSSYFL